MDDESHDPCQGALPVPGLVRRARRRADLSQRQMARLARVAAGTVGKVESGAIMPSLRVLSRLFGVAGLYLVVVDADGHVIEPLLTCADLRDGADRRYPAHLDVIIDPELGQWWGDQYGLAAPPETFHRDRRARDEQRARSAWEVRVARHRGEPPPPAPVFRW